MVHYLATVWQRSRGVTSAYAPHAGEIVHITGLLAPPSSVFSRFRDALARHVGRVELTRQAGLHLQWSPRSGPDSPAEPAKRLLPLPAGSSDDRSTRARVGDDGGPQAHAV